MNVCPECETKAYLSTMEMTPELVEEMAAAEPCLDYAGDGEYSRRLQICKECSRLIGGMTCAECGCSVQFRAKHISAHCALTKW